jgi:hypothetical protein
MGNIIAEYTIGNNRAASVPAGNRSTRTDSGPITAEPPTLAGRPIVVELPQRNTGIITEIVR